MSGIQIMDREPVSAPCTLLKDTTNYSQDNMQLTDRSMKVLQLRHIKVKSSINL